MDNKEQPTPGVSPPGQPPTLNVNQLIDSYVQLRDRKRLLESQHKEALKPYVKVMEEIEGQLLQIMQQSGVKTLTGTGGNAHQSLKKRATIRDAEAFQNYVIENELWHLADWKANANAVFDHIQEHNGVPPPGVNPSSYVAVNVRRPTDKDEE